VAIAEMADTANEDRAQATTAPTWCDPVPNLRESSGQEE